MSLKTRYTFGAVLLTIAVAATAPQAGATELYRGTVNLPYETHWGNVVLYPGSYNFTIEPGFSGLPVIYVFGEGGKQRIMTTTFDSRARSGRGSLTLVNVAGTYVVKRLNADVIGRSFDFAVPKQIMRYEAAHSGAETETNVSVLGTH